jgi:predicted alpha/beta-fold hydrolase
VPRKFQPFVRNAHLLTIASNFWPRQIDELQFPPTRHLYETDADTKVLVIEHQPHGTPKGQILLLHGLEGSSDAGYIKSFAQAALLRGFGVHRSNMRTCGGTESLSETMYHSGLTSDTKHVLEQIRQGNIGPVILVGFSLGGNVALKLAGELSETELLNSVCAVSTPIDLAACVRQLDRPSNRLYANRFLGRLKERIRRKALHVPHLYSAEGIDSIKGIWEFDDRYTGPLFGFGNAETYYRTQSAQRFLDQIRIPALLIQAKDDPIIPFETYRQPAFERNPCLHLIAVEHGGHLGFISRRRPRFWLDGVALSWIERQVESASARSDATLREQTAG